MTLQPNILVILSETKDLLFGSRKAVRVFRAQNANAHGACCLVVLIFALTSHLLAQIETQGPMGPPAKPRHAAAETKSASPKPSALVSPKLKSGVRMLSETVRANAREGDIGGPLRIIANAHPDTIIGSYPFQDEDKKPNTNLVVRSRDPDKLSAAMAAVKQMLAGLNVVR